MLLKGKQKKRMKFVKELPVSSIGFFFFVGIYICKSHSCELLFSQAGFDGGMIPGFTR
jgi:hypothetical protein